jgi:hypothetical protein
MSFFVVGNNQNQGRARQATENTNYYREEPEDSDVEDTEEGQTSAQIIEEYESTSSEEEEEDLEKGMTTPTLQNYGHSQHHMHDGMVTPTLPDYYTGMATPKIAAKRKCSAFYDRSVDSWKMSWENAIELKSMLPDLQLFWTPNYPPSTNAINEGTVILTEYYEALDCDELDHLINIINATRWKYPFKYQNQNARRIKLPDDNEHKFRKVPLETPADEL